MTERNQCGCADEGLGMDATSGVTPPLLPTLLMALVLGAGSLLCREPDAPAPAPTALAAQIASAPATLVAEAVPTTPFVPAALAFPRQFPLAVAAQAGAPMPVIAQHRPAGPRVASLRRVAPPKAAVAPEIPRVDPVASVARAEVPVEADDFLPDLALPFAPAIQAVGRARDFVGVQGAAARTQASALGGAVVDFVGTLR
ncbi:hypothetical protein [Methylobacterium sp. J-090]|uniref:hypothetical protein n=1 Tax=Methylobacterium sp. J-090 TaxID=2836666 RepID=UPI001FBA5823|nr:hypothetical protein [Methylobacterium sp. J-090]MCJ2080904.1 hypothetical protein [Methylobacterium sp. J-090]